LVGNRKRVRHMVGMRSERYGMGRRKTPLSPRAAKITTVITCVVFVAFGVFFILNAKSQADSVSPIPGGRTTTGLIVNVNTGQNCGRSGCTPWWQPTIQFTSASDKLVTFTGPEDMNMDEIGQNVTVSYDLANPSEARDLSANVGPTDVEIGVGAFVIAFAFLFVVVGHRRFSGSNTLFAAHTSASGSADLANTGAASTGSTPTSSWVGHRYLHSRTAFVIADVVFVGLLTWAIVSA
jgi:hypothetical protein